MKKPTPLPRREFLQLSAAGLATVVVGQAAMKKHDPLPDFVGINLSSFSRQNRATEASEHIDPYDVPRIMRGELNLRVIDLVSTMLNTRESGPLEKFRKEADRAGCVITNLKVNLPALRFDSDDAATRRQGLDEYKRWIEAASLLGVRWVRPFPADTPPRWETLVAGYRELADHADRFNITLLVENYKWLDAKPDAIPRLVAALEGRVRAQPDTFNWVDDPTRRRGLANAFPLAASCDFKVRDLGPNYEHPAYELRPCFDIGYKAGFRGPWCIEHAAPTKAALLHNMKWITAQLRAWTAAGAG